jgi:mono/diheme cytochrome c family protein
MVGASLAAGQAGIARSSATTIAVTLGKPSEYGFALSKSQVPIGTVTFKVTDAGLLPHSFKVCARASKSDTAVACAGRVTPTLQPGKSATLRVVFTSKGSFEYLSAVPGDASAGMKGLLGVGVKAAAGSSGQPTATATTTTTPSKTTTPGKTTPIVKPPATETLIGDPSVGASVFGTAGCASCHTLAAAKSTGTTGLNLDQLAPAQSLVVTTVTNGAFNMPAFGGQLTASQINAVAAYVYQSTHQ